MSNSAITLSRITKSFGSTQVLKEISLDVSPGEVLVLIGASGSGKSTVLRIMSGLETADGGEIWVNNVPLHDHKRSREICGHVGMVFQHFELFPHLSIIENLTLAQVKVLKRDKTAAREKGLKLLERVGLSAHANKFPAQLSGGQQQRVAIARALAMSPKVLLCDEITSALDPELVGEVLKVLEQLAAEGMTLILVTHEMNFAREVGDRVVFMHQGKVWEQGDSKTLFANPQTTELKQFISSVRGLN